MFLDIQTKKDIEYYKELLSSVASLSKLFSENNSPYLNYRVVENIFCDAFNAENLSRADCSADAKKDRIGIGIKTFLNGNGKSLQKVAEFNKESSRFQNKDPEELIKLIATLRNERISFTKRAYGIDTMLYHCLARDPGRIMGFETNMDSIDLGTIKKISKTKSNTILFSDKHAEYSYNLSKSTLFKRFITKDIMVDLDIRIVDNPYSLVSDLVRNDKVAEAQEAYIIEREYVILPFYSGYGEDRYVPEKSGLNQWNAAGRKRDPNEIYIKIPAWIHKEFPMFFPDRDVPFDLSLPDGNKLSTKVCQQGKKALMSNPNKDLGKWLLRRVLSLKENELLTYDRLKILNIDSVIIYKQGFGKYSIDFCTTGSYDNFFIEKII